VIATNLIWESLKTPARQALFALYAFAVNWVINFLAVKLGFVISEEQKILMLSWGTPIVWWLLSWVDKIMHEIGKARDKANVSVTPVVSPLTKGISRF
jgi:hypothetical protein